MLRWNIIQACIPLSVTFRLQLSCLNIMNDSSQAMRQSNYLSLEERLTVLLFFQGLSVEMLHSHIKMTFY